MRRIPFCMPHTMTVSLAAGCGDAHRAQPMTAIRAANGVRDFSSGWRGLGGQKKKGLFPFRTLRFPFVVSVVCPKVAV